MAAAARVSHAESGPGISGALEVGSAPGAVYGAAAMRAFVDGAGNRSASAPHAAATAAAASADPSAPAAAQQTPPLLTTTNDGSGTRTSSGDTQPGGGGGGGGAKPVPLGPAASDGTMDIDSDLTVSHDPAQVRVWQ
jgi:hypothetical protein